MDRRDLAGDLLSALIDAYLANRRVLSLHEFGALLRAANSYTDEADWRRASTAIATHLSPETQGILRQAFEAAFPVRDEIP